MYHSAYIAALQSLTVAVNAARPSVFQRGLHIRGAGGVYGFTVFIIMITI